MVLQYKLVIARHGNNEDKRNAAKEATKSRTVSTGDRVVKGTRETSSWQFPWQRGMEWARVSFLKTREGRVPCVRQFYNATSSVRFSPLTLLACCVFTDAVTSSHTLNNVASVAIAGGVYQGTLTVGLRPPSHEPAPIGEPVGPRGKAHIRRISVLQYKMGLPCFALAVDPTCTQCKGRINGQCRGRINMHAMQTSHKGPGVDCPGFGQGVSSRSV